jgi:hypothetical protein
MSSSYYIFGQSTILTIDSALTRRIFDTVLLLLFNLFLSTFIILRLIILDNRQLVFVGTVHRYLNVSDPGGLPRIRLGHTEQRGIRISEGDTLAALHSTPFEVKSTSAQARRVLTKWLHIFNGRFCIIHFGLGCRENVHEENFGYFRVLAELFRQNFLSEHNAAIVVNNVLILVN